jgi:hypothetical protein
MNWGRAPTMVTILFARLFLEGGSSGCCNPILPAKADDGCDEAHMNLANTTGQGQTRGAR